MLYLAVVKGPKHPVQFTARVASGALAYKPALMILGVILELYGDYGLCGGYIGVILGQYPPTIQNQTEKKMETGSYRGYIGIMENKVETTILTKAIHKSTRTPREFAKELLLKPHGQHVALARGCFRPVCATSKVL